MTSREGHWRAKIGACAVGGYGSSTPYKVIDGAVVVIGYGSSTLIEGHRHPRKGDCSVAVGRRLLLVGEVKLLCTFGWSLGRLFTTADCYQVER